ncbi:unnamed protein product [Lupinus luteus]|uniref:Uncharacterized protein n=1 Tax=Lupinus luteus TaxID=3873 RepID=A0AAV1WP07_LUPLU
MESNSDDPNMPSILNRIIMPESIHKHGVNWKDDLRAPTIKADAALAPSKPTRKILKFPSHVSYKKF